MIDVNKDKKLIVISKDENINSSSKVFEFISNYFGIENSNVEIDAAHAIEGVARDCLWYHKKYMGFFDAKKSDVDKLYKKYQKNSFIEWIIISLK